MAVYTTKDTDLTKVADAIREKGGTADKLSYPDGMVEAIEAIPSGGGTDTLAEYISNSTYEYEVPATVTKLANQAFKNLNRLTKISFKGDDTIAPNDGSFFSGCSALKEADLSNLNALNCTTVTYWFAECSALQNLKLPTRIGKITNFASFFSNCKNLTSIDLSTFDTSKATNMSNMFSGCSSLTSINLSGFDTSNVSGMSYMFQNCYNLAEFDLSFFKLKTVGDVIMMNGLFSGCTALKSLDFSKLDMSKVNYTSSLCQNCKVLDLATDYVNDTLKYVESNCFYNCTALTLTKIGDALKKIGSYAFYNCKALTTLWVPATCTSIGSSAFSGSGLTDFYTPLTERPSGWDANAFPSTVTIHYGVSKEEYEALISTAE